LKIKLNITLSFCLFIAATVCYGQVNSAKTFINSSLTNCNEAIKEVKNASLFIDSANQTDVDTKTKERFIRLAESEIIASKRLVIFSEDEAENAMKITDDECETASTNIAPIFIETTIIISKLEDAAIQLNLWLKEKELREAVDFVGGATKNLNDTFTKYDVLLAAITKAKTTIDNCK
jgi:hypothetical protein